MFICVPAAAASVMGGFPARSSDVQACETRKGLPNRRPLCFQRTADMKAATISSSRITPVNRERKPNPLKRKS
jgi:hypothetical protein